mmetsp:Transcript_7926/g.19659  ORF Transcript_7926/g.19659 Transcript_7926/m.19659 type:complete len:307 (-) Transcript_7926:700-1620(-)
MGLHSALEPCDVGPSVQGGALTNSDEAPGRQGQCEQGDKARMVAKRRHLCPTLPAATLDELPQGASLLGAGWQQLLERLRYVHELQSELGPDARVCKLRPLNASWHIADIAAAVLQPVTAELVHQQRFGDGAPVEEKSGVDDVAENLEVPATQCFPRVPWRLQHVARRRQRQSRGEDRRALQAVQGPPEHHEPAERHVGWQFQASRAQDGRHLHLGDGPQFLKLFECSVRLSLLRRRRQQTQHPSRIDRLRRHVLLAHNFGGATLGARGDKPAVAVAVPVLDDALHHRAADECHGETSPHQEFLIE